MTNPIDNLVERSRWACDNFYGYVRTQAQGAVQRCIAIMRSHYPFIEMQRINDGYALGTTEENANKMYEESKHAALTVVDDSFMLEFEGPPESPPN